MGRRRKGDSTTGDLFGGTEGDIKGMVREPDRPTSVAAAKQVKRRAKSLRAMVLAFAASHEGGFIDENLVALNPKLPESSLRKRRSELTAEGLIVDSGRKGENKNRQESIVWCLAPAGTAPRDRPPTRKELLTILRRVQPLVRLYGTAEMIADIGRVK